MERRLALVLMMVVFPYGSALAVILDSTGDPSVNTTAPGGALAGSGWQFEGLWGNFLGTPIAPQYFITAKHVGGSVGDVFTYAGAQYTTVALFDSPQSDLRIWEVSGIFPSFAPLYSDNDELGKALVVFGRGTQRGSAVNLGGQLQGWTWGASDGVQRWGTNVVSDIVAGAPDQGDFLAAAFDHDFSVNEAHLSVGDSGGATFIQDEQGRWKLAGISYAVDGPYAIDTKGDGQFDAALFNQDGFYVQDANGDWVPASGPGNFYVTRISSNDSWILSVIDAGPVPQSAVSRETHDGAGAFDIPLPLNGREGIECRRGSGPHFDGHQVVVTFANSVTVDGVIVTSSDGLATATETVSNNVVTVDLASVADAQDLTLTLTHVSDGMNQGNVAIPMGVLVGDTNSDRLVNASDVAQTRSRSGQKVDAANFRSDLNTDGILNAVDTALAKSRSGTALP